MASSSGAAEDPLRRGEIDAETSSNFISQIIEADLASKKHSSIVTRFPPEPNGYPHIGHLKAICINFGLAAKYGGRCHLRFDDTNPETEDEEYVRAIQRDIRWMGFDWGEHLYYASDYFPRFYDLACQLIRDERAFVCSLSDAEFREKHRGTITQAGVPSPYRNRSVEENLDLFERMRKGEFAEGSHVLRAKIDMANPNMKMRDPAIYRIRHRAHYRTGTDWHVYPLYDFAHCLSDAFEGVTHSLCSLEFESNRELYDWFIEHLPVPSVPRQYEFARMNVNYSITSKRKLRRLVEEGKVRGWDDPRMPTLSGMRRAGYTPAALRSFIARTGVSRSHQSVDVSLLEYCVRDDLNRSSRRVLCVQSPLLVTITNYPEGKSEQLDAPFFPPDVPGTGSRPITFSRELWIERSDFTKSPSKKWYRLAPGAEVRLRHAYLITCKEVVEDADGNPVELRCEYDPESLHGNPEGRRVRGTIHWVERSSAVPCELRLYDRLFSHPEPDRGDGEPEDYLNPTSLQVVTGFAESFLRGASPGDRFQFERQGFFTADVDSTADQLVFNRTVTLKDSWSKAVKREASAAREAPAAQLATGPHGDRKKKARAQASSGLPEAPSLELSALGKSLRERHGITEESARLLGRDPELADFFEAALGKDAPAQAIANWCVGELLRELKTRQLSSLPFGPAAVGELVAMIDRGDISGSAAKQIWEHLLAEGGSPKALAQQLNLTRVDSDQDLLPLIEAVMQDFPEHVTKYKNGQLGLLGALVGQVMKRSQGRADPKRVNTLLKDKLE